MRSDQYQVFPKKYLHTCSHSTEQDNQDIRTFVSLKPLLKWRFWVYDENSMYLQAYSNVGSMKCHSL